MAQNKFNDLASRFGKGGNVPLGVKVLAAAGIAVYSVSKSMYTVEAGHRAIIFSRLGGIQKDIMTEGLHFRVPWFHYPIIYDIRSRPRKISSPTGSKDLQMVNISLRVLSRPEASTLPAMYRQLGLDYDEKEAKNGDFDLKMDYLEQKIDLELGTLKLTEAYQEIIDYNYRPGAVKAVISIASTPCEKSPFLLSLQKLRLLWGLKTYRSLGLTYYLVYQPGDIQISGKTQKNIVGFDHDSVYVFGDSKKKPLSGNTEFMSNMVLPTTDVCADFALVNGGAAFNANNLLDAKPNQKRQFAQVVARKVVEDITNIEIEEDCVCEHAFGSYFGKSHCKIVQRKEKEQRHTKGGVKA